MTATIFEAKTKLSELIKKAQEGETVVITAGREKKPVARLAAIEPKKPQRLGVAYNPNFELPASFWEPLSDEDCGYADDPLLETKPDWAK
jgi:antitoxin (DNA-binding transcriptional repressor) of toxin-antitoxin stability system